MEKISGCPWLAHRDGCWWGGSYQWQTTGCREAAVVPSGHQGEPPRAALSTSQMFPVPSCFLHHPWLRGAASPSLAQMQCSKPLTALSYPTGCGPSLPCLLVWPRILLFIQRTQSSRNMKGLAWTISACSPSDLSDYHSWPLLQLLLLGLVFHTWQLSCCWGNEPLRCPSLSNLHHQALW